MGTLVMHALAHGMSFEALLSWSQCPCTRHLKECMMGPFCVGDDLETLGEVLVDMLKPLEPWRNGEGNVGHLCGDEVLKPLKMVCFFYGLIKDMMTIKGWLWKHTPMMWQRITWRKGLCDKIGIQNDKNFLTNLWTNIQHTLICDDHWGGKFVWQNKNEIIKINNQTSILWSQLIQNKLKI